MTRDCMIMILTGFLFASLPSIRAQEIGVWNYYNDTESFNSTPGYYPTAPTYPNASSFSYAIFNDPLNGYSTPDYYYHSPYYAGRMSGRYKDVNGYGHFGRRFDNSDNFSSGISSYQGTSTGPGPNGGYPGAPHGIYQTNYYDTSIYPNTYMRIPTR